MTKLLLQYQKVKSAEQLNTEVVREKLKFEMAQMFPLIRVDCFGKSVVVVVMNEVTANQDEAFCPEVTNRESIEKMVQR